MWVSELAANRTEGLGVLYDVLSSSAPRHVRSREYTGSL